MEQWDLLHKSPKDRKTDSEPHAGAPLADRMRPRNLEEFLGQERVLGLGAPLRLWIETDRLPSIILWGPPGSGKTTLARVISGATRSRFEKLSAVLSGVKDLKEAIGRAEMARARDGSKTILFIDEIHRFNKGQQDALLPHVENGVVTLIGATTENPSFELNSALLSRTRVIRLDPLEEITLIEVLKNALNDRERGLGGGGAAPPFDESAFDAIAKLSEGDARRALTLLESVYLYFVSGSKRARTEPITSEEVREAIEKTSKERVLPYDKSGEEHYNVISAFIKSLRDSDPHAGLYYLARMIEAGEDPLFIARRLVILASEDVGNADPRALQVAIAVKEAVDFVGMPEGRIALAQAVTYLALAPKSNASYAGGEEALEEVRKSGALAVPMHIRNAVTKLMKSEGYGKGYRYAHDQIDERAKQPHLPKQIQGKIFYRPKDVGLEKELKKKLDALNPDFE